MQKNKYWQKLQNLAESPPVLNELFARDKLRARKFYFSACGVGVDISKQHINDEIMQALLGLAKEKKLQQNRADMFAGKKINITEDRPVLHAALRGSAGDKKTNRQVLAMRERMREFADKVRLENKIKSIIHIGIGGSDLGPRLLYDVLGSACRKSCNIHFVNNVDGASINHALELCEPKSTLVIVVSKSFSTQETKLNGIAARQWLGGFVHDNLLAVTANMEAAKKFGVGVDNIFEFWDWVGGRFSLWSAVSLSLVLAFGADIFEKLLKGAHDMDAHFQSTDLDKNMPVLLALLDIWNKSFLARPARAVIPYSRALRKLPLFLQQLEMESLGKSAGLAGGFVNASAQIVFGDEGTNAQHAFFQALHQGTDIIPVDFIATLSDNTNRPEHHKALLANCFAQSEALMRGREHEDKHKFFRGNRPSTTFLLDRLDAYTLGALLALFEHKVFVLGVVLGVNAFDQWGVELGKIMARQIEAELGSETDNHDSSTNHLITLAKPYIKS